MKLLHSITCGLLLAANATGALGLARTGGGHRRPALMWAHPDNNGTEGSGRLMLDVGTLMSARDPGFEFEVHLPTGVSVVAKSEKIHQTHRGQYFGHYHADGSPMFPGELDLLDVGGEVDVPALAAYSAWHITSPVIDSNVPHGERLFSAEDTSDLLLLHHTDEGRVFGFLDVDGRRTLLVTNEEGELVVQPTGAGDAAHGGCTAGNAVESDDERYADDGETVTGLLEQQSEASTLHQRSNTSLQQWTPTAFNELKITIYVLCCDGVLCQAENDVAFSLDAALRQSLVNEQSVFATNEIRIQYLCHDIARFNPSINADHILNRLRVYYNGAGADLRDGGNHDVVMFMFAHFDKCGAAHIADFYQGNVAPGWTAYGANRAEAYAVFDTDCAIAENAFVHQLGHLMGMRHNRKEDLNDFSLENHGGVFLIGNQCYPSVMCPHDIRLSPCPLTHGRQRTGNYVLSSKVNYVDFFNGLFLNNSNNVGYHLNSLVEIAKYF